MRRMGPKQLTGMENSRSKIFCWTHVTRIFQKSVFTENTFGSPLLADGGHKGYKDQYHHEQARMVRNW
jgi:hypothetical protein